VTWTKTCLQSLFSAPFGFGPGGVVVVVPLFALALAIQIVALNACYTIVGLARNPPETKKKEKAPDAVAVAR